jgi:pyrroloquinoline quinone biosynthesis protein B
VLALLFALAGLAAAPGPEAVVLGIAQDGGVPHAGCHQALCVEARKDPAKRRLVASLGLLDSSAGGTRRFLIDATPDFGEQMERLGGLPDGILLTHAHIGHVTGLLQLGREVLGARRVPVYCTAAMAKFLRENRPWSRLVSLENIEIREVAFDREFALSENLHVTAIRVPHRDEDSDTAAFLVRGPERWLLWLPDIDKWEKWDRSLADFLRNPRLTAFVDGTFFDANEIPGRSIEQIPHPLVSETEAILGRAGDPLHPLDPLPPLAGRMFFIHLNHTNRLLWDTKALDSVAVLGIGVAQEGQRVPL